MDINEKKVDRRVVKTKRAIHNAFAKLLTMKNIDAITIKDIADEADVNRKTIYNYYNGIYELQGEIENEIVNTFEHVIEDIDFKTPDATGLVFNRLTTIFNEDIDFYGHLLDFNVNSMLVRKMVQSLKALITVAFEEQNLFPKEKIAPIVDFIAAGMLGAYQCWFNGGRIQPIEQFSDDIRLLVDKGIDAFSK